MPTPAPRAPRARAAASWRGRPAAPPPGNDSAGRDNPTPRAITIQSSTIRACTARETSSASAALRATRQRGAEGGREGRRQRPEPRLASRQEGEDRQAGEAGGDEEQQSPGARAPASRTPSPPALAGSSRTPATPNREQREHAEDAVEHDAEHCRLWLREDRATMVARKASPPTAVGRRQAEERPHQVEVDERGEPGRPGAEQQAPADRCQCLGQQEEHAARQHGRKRGPGEARPEGLCPGAAQHQPEQRDGDGRAEREPATA